MKIFKKKFAIRFDPKIFFKKNSNFFDKKNKKVKITYLMQKDKTKLIE